MAIEDSKVFAAENVSISVHTDNADNDSAYGYVLVSMPYNKRNGLPKLLVKEVNFTRTYTSKRKNIKYYECKQTVGKLKKAGLI